MMGIACEVTTQSGKETVDPPMKIMVEEAHEPDSSDDKRIVELE